MKISGWKIETKEDESVEGSEQFFLSDHQGNEGLWRGSARENGKSMQKAPLTTRTDLTTRIDTSKPAKAIIEHSYLEARCSEIMSSSAFSAPQYGHIYLS